MQFRLLGPVEVENDGQLLPLGSAKQRALLAVLLLRANEVVSRDRLIDDLWAGRPPDSAAHSLEVYVSRLRKTLQSNGGDPMVATRPGGYLLRLASDQLDLSDFERLTEEGRSALASGNYDTAAARLREALGLWRGRALGELADEPFARPDAERLEEQRLAALEDRIEAELALGRHAALIGELDLLSRKHPLRERPRGELMLALYRSGRQAEALDVYRKTRQQFVEELGIDPSPALQRLEQAILRQDPALELPAQQPARGDGIPLELDAAAPMRRQRLTEGWRRAGIVAVIAGLLFAGVAGAILLLTRGSARSLDNVDANAVGIVDPQARRIEEEVLLNVTPAQLAAGAGSVWAVSPNSQKVLRIDPATAHPTDKIEVGESPSGIAFAGNSVWVANSLEGTVSRIDPSTDGVVDTKVVGNVPTAVAAGFGSIWVTNSGDQSVTRLDARTGRRLRTIRTGDTGRGIAVGGDAVWVSDDVDGHVSRIDPHTNAVTDTIPVGNGATAVVYGAGAVWVANRLDGTLSRIDPATKVPITLPVGGTPAGIAMAAGDLWVSDESTGRIVRFDPRRNKVVATVETGNRPAGIAFADGRIWVGVQAAGPQHRGGTLRIVSGGLSVPDPNGGYSDENLLTATNDGLTAFKKVGGAEGSELVPDLATSLPRSSDGGRTYVFQVRRGVRYSNGQVVRAADFRYSLERVFALRSPGTGYYAGIRGAARCGRRPRRCDLRNGVVTNDAAGTVTFHLVAPDPEFREKLALPFAVAVPVGWPKRTTVVPATGPYVITSYDGTRQLELQRNPRFEEWSKEAQPDGYPDEIVWRFIGSKREMVSAVERGEADWLHDFLPTNRMKELRTQYASQLHSAPVPATRYLFLNTKVPPFNDLRARRALNYAIDRNVAVKLWGGPDTGRPTCQVLPPSFPGYERQCIYTRNPAASGVWTRPDLERARRLISATHAMGMRVTVWTPSPLGGSVPIARYTARVLRSLGYRVTIRRVKPGKFVPTVLDPRTKAQIGLMAWGADYARASEFFTPNLMCSSQHNFAEFCNPKIDAKIKNALAQQRTDPESASRLWADIDRDIMHDAPWVPLLSQRNATLLSKRTGNYQYRPIWGVLLDQLWVK